MTTPRLAARAVILHDDRLLLVNAWPDRRNTLWCAPGGGVESGSSIPDNLAREVHEETGLTVAVGPPCLVNEFHDPKGSFHQVEVFFRCTITSGQISDDWQDPEGIVHSRRFFARAEIAGLSLKPESLKRLAWEEGFAYDPLEPILR
ncbi:NUDIX domain-containing protein [Sagittula salina]|uniref:NUDIX domain-containing protein n=1 Tax=Sagittula salina TaxID=2820268 RepID=A0A940S0T6_9RHOB|nr:NUDIX domain-containing protein [Sagittula salina]MBP0482357.1 NUDIX domain-containing protein [Sagittula salina]